MSGLPGILELLTQKMLNMKTTTSATGNGFNIYQEVTRRIITMLAQGEIPWKKRWCAPLNDNDTINYATGKPYSFLNKMLLGRPGKYMGYSQIKAKGGRIKKGAKGNMVVFYKMFIPAADKKKAEEMEKRGENIDHLKIPLLRYSTVFHMDDIEGITFEVEQIEHQEARRPTDIAEYVKDEYLMSTGVTINEKPLDEFWYDEDTDNLFIPSRLQFGTEEQWYNTMFSGLVKSTASEDRCNRSSALKANPKREDIIREELVCEMGASMIMGGVGLDCDETQRDTASECAYWIEELNKDFRLIVNASSQAEKAARYILKPITTTES